MVEKTSLLECVLVVGLLDFGLVRFDGQIRSVVSCATRQNKRCVATA